MGDYSIEFCGGTHLTNTAQCGLFKLVSESGVAAGVRRIEAVTGKGVLEYIDEQDRIITETASALKTNQVHVLDKKAVSVMDELKELNKKLEEFTSRIAAMRTKNMMAGIRHLEKVNLMTSQVDGLSVNEMKTLADRAKEQMTNGVIVLAANTDDKITFVAMASKEAVSAGVHCGKIIKAVTEICGGKGGGKPDMAQGGGKDALKIDDALAKVDDIVTEMIK